MLELAVHRLVGVLGKDTVVLHRDSPVFLQEAAGYVIDFDLHAVGGLDGGYFQMVGFDIGPAQGLGIREPEAGKAAEDEDVPDGFPLPDRRQVKGDKPFQFFRCQVYDLGLRCLESRVEAAEAIWVLYPFSVAQFRNHRR